MRPMTIGAGAAVAIVAPRDIRIVIGVFTDTALLVGRPNLQWVRFAVRIATGGS